VCGRGARRRIRWTGVLALAGLVLLAGCGSASARGATAEPPSTSRVPGSTVPHASTTTGTTTPPTTTSTTVPARVKTALSYVAEKLGPGASGPAVLTLQARLRALGYWLGIPTGVFDDGTEQAVYALQKAAGLPRDGFVGPTTWIAAGDGVVPRARSHSGRLIEVDLARDLVMFVTNGKVSGTLNTSTGGGYSYWSEGHSSVAVTPTGLFRISRQVDGVVTAPLGQLVRPKYFEGGFAIHGDSSVPPTPQSHGCVRVSNEAIAWIWDQNLAPIGTPVWIY
jgi:peptidoglycan hydrolase-like protein with peptidoglycan-binding domain